MLFIWVRWIIPIFKLSIYVCRHVGGMWLLITAVSFIAVCDFTTIICVFKIYKHSIINYSLQLNIINLGGVPCGACYTTQIWVYEIQECLFRYSVYWFMAFTIKCASVNICLYFYHPYEFNRDLGPSHCFGGLARPLSVEPDPWSITSKA